MLKCNTCGGTYDAVLADGLKYFHACPPFGVQEIKDALSSGQVTLPPRAKAIYDAAVAYDQAHPPAAGELSRVDQLIATYIIERKNRRDENIVGPGAPGQAAPIKAAGLGTTTVP